MSAHEEWEARLSRLEPAEWAAFLTEHSGLPGPRANLSLVDAVARCADAEVIGALLRDDGEYAVMCAAAAAAYRAGDPVYEERARALAGDERWRVREGVAIGLQLFGDTAPRRLAATVSRWADDPDPLVKRAAVAAICEPRLLRSPEMAAVAVEVCASLTRWLAASAREGRSQPAGRTLRQALGYCWSVAVAADPEAGLAPFLALDTSDADVRWIVDQNRRKKRLSRLL